MTELQLTHDEAVVTVGLDPGVEMSEAAASPSVVAHGSSASAASEAVAVTALEHGEHEVGAHQQVPPGTCSASASGVGAVSVFVEHVLTAGSPRQIDRSVVEWATGSVKDLETCGPRAVEGFTDELVDLPSLRDVVSVEADVQVAEVSGGQREHPSPHSSISMGGSSSSFTRPDSGQVGHQVEVFPVEDREPSLNRRASIVHVDSTPVGHTPGRLQPSPGSLTLRSYRVVAS